MHQLDVLLINFVTKKIKGKHAERNSAIFLSNLPLRDEHGTEKTLVEIGHEHNLTRESVRQIVSRTCNKIKSEKDILTLFDSFMNELDALCPVSVEYANEYFMSKGLIKYPSVVSLTKIYQKLMSCNNVRHVHALGVLENRKSEGMVQCIHSYVIKKVVHNGAVGMHELIDRFGDVTENEDTMRSLLMIMDNVIELPLQHFYLGDKGRNRLIHRLNTIYNVFSCVDVKKLEPAIERCWKADINKEIAHAESMSRLNVSFKPFTQVVPLPVILAILEMCSIAKVEGDMSYSLVKSHVELKWVDRTILDFIKSSGGEEREKNIENYVLSLDSKKRFACMQFISNSPLIIAKRRGHYHLLGEL